MNSNPETQKIFRKAVLKGTQNSKARFEHDQSRTGKKVQQSDHDFAQFILDSAEKMNSIEDMIAFEQTLQKVDLLKAKPSADRNSIIAAQQNYEQLSITVWELRNNTDSYFRMNIANKESKLDPHKIVNSNSLDFITANITRMQNRKQFASESESKVWDARITMAKKTGEMFKTLHNNLAANYVRKQKIQEQLKQKQEQQQGRKGKGRE